MYKNCKYKLILGHKINYFENTIIYNYHEYHEITTEHENFIYDIGKSLLHLQLLGVNMNNKLIITNWSY